MTSLKAFGWSGHIFGGSTSRKPLKKALVMSPSSTTVRGGQYDAKYVALELLHAAFVTDGIWGDMPEL